MQRKDLEEQDKRFHENFVKRLVNQILTGLLILLSYLPFRVLYLVSDIMYVLVRFVFKYRYEVVTGNLTKSFPEKSAREIACIRNRFYRHFCDLFFESIKLYSISDKEMDKRLKITGTELPERYHKEGKSIVALALHHNNWEWSGFAQSKLNHLILTVYNPVRGNNSMEKFLLHNRQRWGCVCVPVNKAARAVVENKIKGNIIGIWLAADQTPPANSKFWTVFLNQETPFFNGPEKIAQSGNLPVFFQRVKKTGRGRYEIEISLLFGNTAEMNGKDILLGYVRKSEEIIRQEPEYYLWSHRRWKHKRPEGTELTV